MKKLNLGYALKKLAVFATTATVLISCGGSGGGGSTSGYYTSPYLSAQQFVNALNRTDGYYDNEVLKTHTERGDGFFVYYDAAWDEYIAVDMDYLRQIQYWSYYTDNNELAAEYRDVQDSDYDWFNDMTGDGFGDDYEIVYGGFYDYDDFTGEEYFYGVDSGYFYEDEDQTVDTGVMAANEEEKTLFKQASEYSVVFSLPAKEALALVSMEKEVKRMLADAKNGELLEADKLAFAANIEHFTGKSIADFEAAKTDTSLAAQLKEDIAAKLGTPGSANALEELFNLDSML